MLQLLKRLQIKSTFSYFLSVCTKCMLRCFPAPNGRSNSGESDTTSAAVQLFLLFLYNAFSYSYYFCMAFIDFLAFVCASQFTKKDNN